MTIIIATSYWKLIKVIKAIKIMILIVGNKNIVDDIGYKKDKDHVIKGRIKTMTCRELSKKYDHLQRAI